MLHDAGMDIRAPSHALTRAHAILRARRRIDEAKPDWALTEVRSNRLRGRGSGTDRAGGSDHQADHEGLLEEPLDDLVRAHEPLAAELAALDQALARANGASRADGPATPSSTTKTMTRTAGLPSGAASRRRRGRCRPSSRPRCCGTPGWRSSPWSTSTGSGHC